MIGCMEKAGDDLVDGGVGKAIAGAAIELAGKSVTTNTAGVFKFTGVSLGSYNILIHDINR